MFGHRASLGDAPGATRPRSPRRSRLVRLGAASLAGAAGIWTVCAQVFGDGLSVSVSHHLISGGRVLPMRALGIAAGLGLLLLARALWRGRRLALLVAVAALVAVALGRAAIDPDPLATGVDLALAAALLTARRWFPNGPGLAYRRALRAGTLVVLSIAGLYVAYALSLAATHHRNGVESAAALAATGLLRGAWWVRPRSPLSLVVLGFVASLIVGGVMLVRALLLPERRGEGHLPSEHERAARLLRRHSGDSLHPFTLREDKSLHFAAGGYLAYRVLRETAVVSGDPVGPPGSAAEILASFLAEAERRGWRVVVTGASAECAAAAADLGMRALRIGEEAVVDPRGFSLEGRRIRKVRQSVTRARRLGWTVEAVAGSRVSPELAAELEQVDAAWRRSRERVVGFAMTLGRPVSAAEDPGGLYVTGRDPQGVLRSFLRFAAFSGGISLDVMRRRGDEPNGLTEAQVVAALEYARRRGMSEVSLNFAGFAHLMAADAALGRGQRAFRLLLRALHGRFQLERLVRFNAKFAPDWRPRFLLYERLTYLPLASLRVLQAEAYLPGPRDGARPGRWEGDGGGLDLAGVPGRLRSRLPRPARRLAWLAPGLAIWALLGTATSVVASTVRPAGATITVIARPSASRLGVDYRHGHRLIGSPVLYLPRDRPVAVRYEPGTGYRPAYRDRARILRRGGDRVLRFIPHRVGAFPVLCESPCTSPATTIRAEVLSPTRYRAEMLQRLRAIAPR